MSAADVAGAPASLQDFLSADWGDRIGDDVYHTMVAQHFTVRQKLSGLLRDLSGLGLARIERTAKCGPGSVHQSQRARAPAIGTVATADSMWAEVAAMWNDSSPYIVTTIDKWARKVRLSAAARKRKFRALDQSIEVQIDAVMSNRERVIRRTRIMRRQRSTQMGNSSPEGETPIVLGSAVAPSEDCERFDDDDFYPKLVAENAEMRVAPRDTISGRIGPAVRAVKQYPSRKRKGLNTRASKGRRLQMSIHTKLVNFVAPLPAPGTSSDTSELFTSLFGAMRRR